MIIFDLDGTLADNEHRQHLVQGHSKDWDAFFEACDQDKPMAWCAVLPTLWAAGHDIQIWSGRSQAVEAKTLTWLDVHIYRPRRTVGRPPLRMRPVADFTPDDELKERWLVETLDAGAEIHMVFDDRKKVVDMWRRHGIPCAQVAPGDF